MQKTISLTVAALVLLAHSAGAQERGPVGGPTLEAARVAAAELSASQSLPTPVVFHAATAATPPRVEALAARMSPARSTTRSLLHTVGGAAVGAFVGYFTSQVVRSDWDKESNSEVNGYRMGFALGGALAGSVGGLLIGTRAPIAQMGGVATRTVDEELITTDQIVSSGLANVFDLVQALHPEWLRTRGTRSMYEAAGTMFEGTPVNLGGPTIMVYLDDARMGGLEALRQIPTTTVGEVRFLNATQATYKWGIGHGHGAIWVTSAR